MSLKKTADIDLARLVRSGERESHKAFTELYKRWSRRVYFRAIRIVYDPSDAEEITQEIFFAFYRLLVRSRNEIKEPGHYLMRSVTNSSINCIEHKKVKSRAFGELRENYKSRMEKPDPVGSLAVREILGHIPPKFRILVVQKYFENMSTRKIAEESGKAVRTVNFDLWRLRRLLLKEFHSAGLEPGDIRL